MFSSSLTSRTYATVTREARGAMPFGFIANIIYFAERPAECGVKTIYRSIVLVQHGGNRIPIKQLTAYLYKST